MEDITTYTNGLNKTLKGKNNTFFYINDSTNELRQHYDQSYTPKFNSENFIQNHESKRKSLEEKRIDFETFIIPDKSIILKEELPFDSKNPRRNVDQINEYVHDLLSIMDSHDYLINDFNLKQSSIVKIVAYILSYFYPVKNMYQYTEELMNNLNVDFVYHKGTLFKNDHWSYSKDDESYKEYSKIFTEKFDVNSIDYFPLIPRQFKIFNNKRSIHYRNDGSISNKKALILVKSINSFSFVPVLSSYFREVFFYQDWNYYNPYLVEWFKPDVVIEIKDEKELENMDCPKFVPKFGNPLIPIAVQNSVTIENNQLSLFIKCTDLRRMPVNTNCVLSIDGVNVSEFVLKNGQTKFKYDASDLEKGEHQISILVENTNITKAKKVVKTITID